MPAHRRALFTGTLFALAAGLMWGLVFIAPTLLAAYSAPLLTVGRYLAFGVIAIPLALWDRRGLAELSRDDWIEALKLAAVGNLAYYFFLSAAIQRAGGPLPTMLIGTLPVVIAITANLRRGGEAKLPWSRLGPSLALIGLGLACVNQAETSLLPPEADLARYASGALLAVLAVACWTWYPIRNAEWLRAHAERSPRIWATAQGVATLPLALAGYALWWALEAARGSPFPMPLGPQPGLFLALMLSLGLLASWLGTLCWNEASQRLPPALSGQLIVFETLSALAYAFVLRGHAPGWLTGAGAVLLVAGVVWALRTPQTPAPALN